MTGSIGSGGTEANTPPYIGPETEKDDNIEQESPEALSQENEIKEKPEALSEVREAAESVEKATLKPEEKVETERPIKESEDLEAAFSAAMEAAPEKANPVQDSRPAETREETEETAEAAVAGGQAAEDRVGAADTVTEDGVEAVVPAADGGPRTEDREEATEITLQDAPEAGRISVEAPTTGAETVMIDTVPLPESPAEEKISPPPADGSQESIGTWPTPDTSLEGGGVSPPEIVTEPEIEQEAASPESAQSAAVDETQLDSGEDASDLSRAAERAELLDQLAAELPEGAQEFSDGAAGELVEKALSGESGDFLLPTREAVQDRFGELSSRESDAVVGTTLLKASQELDAIAADLEGHHLERLDNPEAALSQSAPLTDRRYLLDSLLGYTNADQLPDESGDSDPDQGDDAQSANIDLQDMGQKQQQSIQMMSNISKLLADTANAVTRKIG